jgi:hypothetical protein
MTGPASASGALSRHNAQVFVSRKLPKSGALVGAPLQSSA